MLKQTDYLKIRDELIRLYNSPDPQDKMELAYHYGNFGYNSLAVKFMQESNMHEFHIQRHLNQLDSIYTDYPAAQGVYNEAKQQDFSKLQSFQIVCQNYDNHSREAGLYIHLIPYLEVLKSRYDIQTVYFDCNPRLADFFEKYFPYVKIGTAPDTVTMWDIVDHVQNLGGASLLRTQILKISKRIRGNRIPKFVGMNWFCNTLLERYRSLPIGMLINTIGNHKTNFEIKSLQYNDPVIDIEIYNRYSKNKIVGNFYNDIDTPILDIVDAVADCKMFIGVQSEASVIAFSLFAIPTIVSSSCPAMYWYFINQINPYIKPARMRFAGDYEYTTKIINKYLEDEDL